MFVPVRPGNYSDTQQYLKAEEAENEEDKQSQVRRQQKPDDGRFATDGECVMGLVSVSEGVLCLLSSSSCRACFGVMVTCGGGGGGGWGGVRVGAGGVAAALQASARFVPSCVRVNTFCSRPSVQAQICMRVGRLGWKRRRGRRLERGRRRGKRGGIKGNERQRVGAENSVIFILGLRRTFYNQMPLFLPKGVFYFIYNYE